MSKLKHLNGATSLFMLLACSVPHITAQQLSEDLPSWRQYSYLLRSSTLEWLVTEPFQLKVNLTVNDLDGNPIDTGTAEETWGKEKVLLVDTQLVQEGRGLAVQDYLAHTRERYLVKQMMASFVRPFPSAVKRETFNANEFHQTIDGTELNCFNLVDTPRGKPTGESYCTNSDNRLAFITGPGSLIVRRESFRRFQSHEIPMDIDFLYNGKVAIKAHVTELDNVIAASGTSSQPASSPANSRYVSSSILLGQRLNAPTPGYPKEAKKQHIKGSVLLAAVISRHGAITGLEVIASPNPLLSEAARKAVQQWTYKPYLLKGEPTEVDTTITVNFNLN